MREEQIVEAAKVIGAAAGAAPLVVLLVGPLWRKFRGAPAGRWLAGVAVAVGFLAGACVVGGGWSKGPFPFATASPESKVFHLALLLIPLVLIEGASWHRAWVAWPLRAGLLGLFFWALFSPPGLADYFGWGDRGAALRTAALAAILLAHWIGFERLDRRLAPWEGIGMLWMAAGGLALALSLTHTIKFALLSGAVAASVAGIGAVNLAFRFPLRVDIGAATVLTGGCTAVGVYYADLPPAAALSIALAPAAAWIACLPPFGSWTGLRAGLLRLGLAAVPAAVGCTLAWRSTAGEAWV